MNVELNKSVRERIFHAVIFTLLASIIIALFLAQVLRTSRGKQSCAKVILSLPQRSAKPSEC